MTEQWQTRSNLPAQSSRCHWLTPYTRVTHITRKHNIAAGSWYTRRILAGLINAAKSPYIRRSDQWNVSTRSSLAACCNWPFARILPQFCTHVLCRGYMWNKIISKLFQRLIVAREYIQTCSVSLKWFWNNLRRGYMWNKTLKLFQKYFKIILFHMYPQH